MLIIPAIDLKDAKVVRLLRGRFEDKTTYSTDPIKTALHWQREGAKYLHVVDLDGARTGKIAHLDIVRKMARSIKVPIEFGGGVRDTKCIKKVLKCGVQRVVLGSKVQDEKFLRSAFKDFAEKIILSIDARDNIVRLNGWQKKYSKLEIMQLLLMLEDIGFREVIYTDISRDGALNGPNITAIKKILKKSRLSLIASGGVSCLADLFKLKSLEKQGLIGAIVGKALYEGKFTLKEALKIS
ncbi:MAG: 1-(5-phosphoribosyl)-5-[(5-phosphoribosylamino)methylideneamino]imidazole-4-carboxamide isomerase [Candidatus Omnitrophica bacterium]|nr:1-(5-phosphoribosyl)-5-[(5-phosphoribosylamino)methylideneamino]imidazole-4-carboxamide isomerase [Candidatus Omnitrophota bacterium]